MASSSPATLAARGAGASPRGTNTCRPKGHEGAPAWPYRAHKQWTPERLIHWGSSIGPNTGHFVTQLLLRFRHPEHGYRSCLGLLSLSKRYGASRVEAACTLALELGAGHYRHVRDILTNGRDLIKRPVPEPEWVAPAHDNVRGAAHYH